MSFEILSWQILVIDLLWRHKMICAYTLLWLYDFASGKSICQSLCPNSTPFASWVMLICYWLVPPRLSYRMSSSHLTKTTTKNAIKAISTLLGASKGNILTWPQPTLSISRNYKSDNFTKKMKSNKVFWTWWEMHKCYIVIASYKKIENHKYTLEITMRGEIPYKYNLDQTKDVTFYSHHI
jgi:hypothetical protein